MSTAHALRCARSPGANPTLSIDHHQPMRILYDGAIYQWQRTGGVNRYFRNLISGLPPAFSPVITTVRRQIEAPQHPRLRILGLERFRPQRLSLKVEAFYFRRALAKETFDIIHPTYYSLLSQSPIERRSTPIVVTFYDMIHDFFPELDPLGSVVAAKRQAAAAADALICISENTKRDLIEQYGVSEAKITVTPLASELSLDQTTGCEPVPPQPYFLYVGGRTGYKNFATVLAALARLAAANKDVMLALVGPALVADENRKLAQLRLSSRVVNFGNVPDEHLAKLYHNSVALIYPSLYEGFGLPILEAMECGTAVIAANRSSLPEVAGDAGLLFNPDSITELTDMMRQLLDDTSNRLRLIEKGMARARQFSWQRTIDQTLEVYRSVAS